MEEDDDFGDLYTDVLRPSPLPILLPASQKPSLVPPGGTAAASTGGRGSTDDADESDIILNGSSLPAAPVPESSSIDREQQVSAADSDDDWLLGRDPLPVEEPGNWMEDDEDVMVDRVPRVSIGGFPSVGSRARVLDKKDGRAVSLASKEEMDALEGSGSAEKEPEIRDSEDEPVIPGLSGAPATSDVPNDVFVKPSDSDDWDSGSEDDLQIVLNDTGLDMRGAERGDGGGSDEDDEDLVIVTDDQHHHHHQAMEEQDWGDDGVQSSVDGEKKEMLEGAKGSGAAPTASGPGLGYSNHGFHSQHHSMFKYVRPGATPTPRPAMVTAGAVGPVRPPAFGPLAGRGRGDWRPVGGNSFLNMQKGFHNGYGLPPWGNNLSGRPFGSGLDFFLPSHKTVFDVDIESFEDKPWRHPGVDVSDFFNFGLDEEHWKEYCKQVEQLRLESTMQSKIRVYESGRSEQDYDPDLPPELAAAAGHNNMSTDNINLGKLENGPTNLNEQGAISSMRPALPTGRAIQVESGFGERLPSIDTRAPRIRDSDAVIEIVLQDYMDDSRNSNGAFERPDNNFERENHKDFHDDDERPIESEFYGRFPRGSSVQLRESMAFRIPISSEEDGILPLPSEFSRPSNSSPKSRCPADTAKSCGTQHGGRYLPRTSQGKKSSSSERLSENLPIQNLHLLKHEELQKEKSSDGIDGNGDAELSPANNCEIVRKLSTEPKDIEHDDRFTLGDSHEGDGEEEASDFRLSSETGGEDGLINSANRKKLSSCVEQYGAQDNGFGEDSRLTHSDNSRNGSRSGNSRDCRKTNETGEEVMQVHSSKHLGELRKHPVEDDRRRGEEYSKDGRREMVKNRSRGRETMHDSASGHTFRARAEGFEKETDDTVGVWRRREDDSRSNRQLKDRSKGRMTDKKEKIVERGDWIGHNKDDGVRHRDRNEVLTNRRENLEDGEMKRKRDVEPKRERSDKEDSLHGYRAREDSHRRRRVRDDIVDHRKREEEARTKSKNKDDNWHQRDREDRQQLNLAHDDALTLQGRDERRFNSRSSKILSGSGRNKEDLKVPAPDKLYHDKDRRRHGEPSKRNDRPGEENESLNKARGDTHNREKRFSAEKRNVRHDRLSTRHDRPSGVTEEQQVQKERHRESNRKVGESEPVAQKRETSSKRKRGDHSTHRTEFVAKGSREQQSGKHSVAEGKKANGNAENGSDDENEDSRRGRSKLERWTSHKERDYSNVESIVQPSSIIREAEDSREELNESVKPDAARADSAETNADDPLHAANKAGEDRDRHLDTVAKLKMRSERFKLPMPGEKEKEPTGSRKAEAELPAPIPIEAAAIASADADVKLERPARKRKWTGG